MSLDAEERLRVYQQGQRARWTDECPYHPDTWRYKTWHKGAVAAEVHRRRPFEPETVPCRVCGQLTPTLGTQRCDRCGELERRIEADPELARQILGNLGA